MLERDWELFEVLVKILEGDETRRSAVKGLSQAISRKAKLAISLDSEWRRSKVKTEDIEHHGRPDQSAIEAARAARIHQQRCEAIAELASSMKMMMRVASGDLVIDETTAGTGLTTEMRASIWSIWNAEDTVPR